MTSPDPAPTDSRIDVFISHATADDAIVTDIHDVLTAAGLSVWVDHLRLKSGDNWRDAIQQALHISRAGLLVLSGRSADLKREEIWAEVDHFLDERREGRKHFYYALIEEVKPLPYRLSPVTWTKLVGDFKGGMAKLIEAINADRDAHSPPLATPADLRRRGLGATFPHGERDHRLIGRERELAETLAGLSDSIRLTLITGLGGVGKTRLAAEAAYQSTFGGGVVWLRLTDSSTAVDLALAVRDHLGLPRETPENKIWAALNEASVLLVLDNAEDCPETARRGFIEALNRFDLSGGTRVLMTSRQEWEGLPALHRVELKQPNLDAAEAIAQEFIRAKPPRFSLAGYERRLAASAHCHPRLIEYAVAWGNHMPATAVLQALDTLRGSDAEKALDEMVRRTVEQARAGAGGAEAVAALRKLTVCRGGFTGQAAQALLGPGQDFYAAARTLILWNLLRVQSERERYDIDPLVTAAVGEDEATYRVHYAHYLELARQHDEKQDYQGLDVESANLEVAFERMMSAGDAGAALQLADACRTFLENRGRLAQQMAWASRAAAALADHPDAWQRANAQNNLGLAYQSLAEVEAPAENLKHAIAAYREALRFCTAEAAPLAYAAIQNNLGNAYKSLAGVVEAPAENLERAIAAYREALRFRTAEAAPLAYAATQNNLGNAYRALAEVEAPAENLERAIAAYREALRFRTAEAAPLAYAATQNNLGIAYSDLAGVEDRAANLKRAIAAYREALRFRTAEAAPLDYATTQNNLGTAYKSLAGVEERAENLKRAIAAYCEALRFHTAEAAPLDYAMTQNNLGNAYQALAGVEAPAENLERAIAAGHEALRFLTAEAAPLAYATTQHNLGNAYRALAEVEAPAENLERAIAAYREALRFRTAKATPLAYAATQRNLGIAHVLMGDAAAAIVCWREAEKYFRLMGSVEEAERIRGWIEKADGS